jgi:predicted small lipoprotein YifL
MRAPQSLFCASRLYRIVASLGLLLVLGACGYKGGLYMPPPPPPPDATLTQPPPAPASLTAPESGASQETPSVNSR